MAFTPNKNLEQPARGSNPGVWDTPVNSNTGIIDNSFGGVASVALVATDVTLNPSQYQCVFITLTGALGANVAVVFPNVGSFYTVQNLTTNTSAFQVTLRTTTGGQAIGAPWGESFDIMTDLSGHVKFRDLGRIGTYWDYAGSSVPAWVSACTIPPYLNCDGTAFSSATYPTLTTILGGTTLPDSRGRTRFALNQGAARITLASSYGIDGNTRLSGGGSQTINQANLPNVNLTTTISSGQGSHAHTIASAAQIGTNAGGGSGGNAGNGVVINVTGTETLPAMSGTTPLGGSGFNMLPPGYVGGITMIRAA